MRSKPNARPHLCTQCGKHDVTTGGYHLNVSHLYRMMAVTIVEHGEQYDEDKFESHVCGRDCLMKRLNTETDELAVTAISAVTRKVYDQPWEWGGEAA